MNNLILGQSVWSFLDRLSTKAIYVQNKIIRCSKTILDLFSQVFQPSTPRTGYLCCLKAVASFTKVLGDPKYVDLRRLPKTCQTYRRSSTKIFGENPVPKPPLLR